MYVRQFRPTFTNPPFYGNAYSNAATEIPPLQRYRHYRDTATTETLDRKDLVLSRVSPTAESPRCRFLHGNPETAEGPSYAGQVLSDWLPKLLRKFACPYAKKPGQQEMQ